MDVLGGEYSPTDTIKNILYKISTGGYGGITVVFGGSVNNININSNKQYVPTESKISNEKEEDLTSISDDNSKALDEETLLRAAYTFERERTDLQLPLPMGEVEV